GGTALVAKVSSLTAATASQLTTLERTVEKLPVRDGTLFASKLATIDRSLLRSLEQLGDRLDALPRAKPYKPLSWALRPDPSCSTLGGKLGAVATGSVTTASTTTTTTVGGSSTAATAGTTPGAPTGGDADLIPFLLPGGVVPTPRAIALADDTKMTARAR